MNWGAFFAAPSENAAKNRAIRSNLFSGSPLRAGKKDFRFYPLRGIVFGTSFFAEKFPPFHKYSGYKQPAVPVVNFSFLLYNCTEQLEQGTGF
jgi:hypothetical protein